MEKLEKNLKYSFCGSQTFSFMNQFSGTWTIHLLKLLSGKYRNSL